MTKIRDYRQPKTKEVERKVKYRNCCFFERGRNSQKFCPRDQIFLKITFRLLVYLRKGFEVDASWYQIQLPRRPKKWQGPDSGHGTKIKIITTTKGNQQHVQNQQAIWNSFCILVLFVKIFLQKLFIPTPVRFLTLGKKAKTSEISSYCRQGTII